jgi:hypothetical protein
VKTTRHPKRKESGGGKQQTLFPMKSKSKDAEVEAEVDADETMIETPTEEMDVEVESEELQEAQAPSIVGDSLVCLSLLLLSLFSFHSFLSCSLFIRRVTRLSLLCLMTRLS